MRVHIVMHEAFETPGAIVSWARQKNHQLTFTRLYQYKKLPNLVDHLDMVIIMGGPQSPDSTLEEYSYFDVRKEMKWIRKVIEQDKAVLGICLGAQLISGALGASFERSPEREIGVFEISLTDAGTNDPFFSSLPERFSVAHWHGDMPGLTNESEVLAYSEGCPRQIVRYTPRVYGFQCHMEFTPESMAGMVTNCPDDLVNQEDQSYIESPEELIKHDFDQMNQFLFGFLDYLSRV